MRKNKTLWVAIIVALSVLLISCFWLALNFSASHFCDDSDIMLEDMKQFPQSTPTSIPQASPQPTPSAEPEASSSSERTDAPMQKESGKQTQNYAFVLTIRGKKVNVAYGVDEATLKKTPGWLTTSANPGEDGMCVVYGHRNRKHLRVLEKIQYEDCITVIMPDGTIHTYTVTGIQIYENITDILLPTMDGKTLVLVTCYPFRYSGAAPQKIVITAKIKKSVK